ncbi:MAG: Protein of unknown function (DUF2946) [Rhodobacteraceae bacterium HLUCCA08]|nr:MAG: Protein of unknown function (DUF2946) [Rhodobacteraceae bacterium HLUCCA08]
MTRTARLFAFLLAFLVAITGQQLAAARGHVGQQVVLCTGGGLVTITLDANGNPTGPAHFCPDGVSNFVATATLTPRVDPPFVHISRATQPVLPQDEAQLAHIEQKARGPPQHS